MTKENDLQTVRAKSNKNIKTRVITKRKNKKMQTKSLKNVIGKTNMLKGQPRPVKSINERILNFWDPGTDEIKLKKNDINRSEQPALKVIIRLKNGKMIYNDKNIDMKIQDAQKEFRSNEEMIEVKTPLGAINLREPKGLNLKTIDNYRPSDGSLNKEIIKSEKRKNTATIEIKNAKRSKIVNYSDSESDAESRAESDDSDT